MNDIIERILEFWFGESTHDMAATEQRLGFWFGSDRQVDDTIRERFGTTIDAVSAGHHDDWAQEAEGLLALVIVLDQFRRNVYRGTPAAFSHDPQALAFASDAVASGMDGALAPLQRAFLYMPFEHAESLAMQERSVALFAALADTVPQHSRGIFDSFSQHSRQHRDIVARFGRFPHRNSILDRASTEEEARYLAGDAPTFGQD